jgi:hypothetical protein
MTLMHEIKLKAPSAVGAPWSAAVRCPGCRAAAEPTGLGHMPKWRCSDPTCDFARGWRLIPSAGRVYAMPVGEDLIADPSNDPLLRALAVPWHDPKVPDHIPKEERI